ncbi:uncharacterized protein LOC120906750 isoform X2 [Anopheles arabiensis]|uniref:uncharacterized protein LOC120906750 isoform X2 n=1 Tax=Anopheles arabiensis TaxID=7173 RepID=UPI001AADB834|nr:uncharacterized protein LOC120906750 isoform X2 [Anopheles arabiensis]
MCKLFVLNLTAVWLVSIHVLVFIIPGVLYIGYSSRARTMQLQSSKMRRSMNDGSAVKSCIACYAVLFEAFVLDFCSDFIVSNKDQPKSGLY